MHIIPFPALGAPAPIVAARRQHGRWPHNVTSVAIARRDRERAQQRHAKTQQRIATIQAAIAHHQAMVGIWEYELSIAARAAQQSPAPASAVSGGRSHV